MSTGLSKRTLVDLGASDEQAEAILSATTAGSSTGDGAALWRRLTAELLEPDQPLQLHRAVHSHVFRNWNEEKDGPVPAWIPDPASISRTNIGRLMSHLGFASYEQLHRWSVQKRSEFWNEMIRRLGFVFEEQPTATIADENEIEAPAWLPGARLNIVDSCFRADGQAPAVVHQREGGDVEITSCRSLEALTNRVANGLKSAGFQVGDAIAIDMTMNLESVAIYLGIIKAGCTAVSIADSFAPDQVATRLRIAGAKGIFTQDFVMRGGRKLSMYGKIVAAEAPRAVVLPCGDELGVELRDGDLSWTDFLSDDESFASVIRGPDDVTNVLFSSGTTGDPKAIPWTHLTPIKAAADGHLHQDIQEGDVVAWPTNLGWMMGPWLIYASLVNKATIALFDGSPLGREFAKFVESAGVTILGVVPSLVKAWRSSGCLEGGDWTKLKAFSSTGECSNAEDMFFLMSRARYRPVIEYCGGTEIGGGYVTGTLVQPAAPAAFSTPALGLDLVVLDERGVPDENGEVYLVPPAIGLSTTLLHRDHHDVYFAGTPRGPRGELLRRHGDHMECLPGGYYRAHGRVDDTMNLGGVKISSAEIERALSNIEGVNEIAAIAVPPRGGGPGRLVIYTVPKERVEVEPKELATRMQGLIREDLNPLFKIQEVVIVESLPRTASNKVMRRVLRTRFEASERSK
jgi:acetyl-CoA synthetase